MKIVEDIFDGAIRTRRWWDGTKFMRLMTQETDHILAENAEIRKNKPALRKMQAMEWSLQIPTLDYYNIIKANPDLTCADAEIRNKAWRKYIVSDESLPYRVREQTSRLGV